MDYKGHGADDSKNVELYAKIMEEFLAKSDFHGEVINLEQVQKYELANTIFHEMYDKYVRDGWFEYRESPPDPSDPAASTRVIRHVKCGTDFGILFTDEDKDNLAKITPIVDYISFDVYWEPDGAIDVEFGFTVFDVFGKFDQPYDAPPAQK